MNLKLSIVFSLYITVLPLSISFSVGAEKVIYFSVFSSKHSIDPQCFFLILWL